MYKLCNAIVFSIKAAVAGAALTSSLSLAASELTTPPDKPQPSAVATGRISINAADAASLANALDGIGKAKAQRIVAWRLANGRFQSIEQLLEIKGIGESTLKRNLDRISL